MKFKVSKREGKFIHGNFRNEKKGKTELVPATDLKVTYNGTKRDLDILLPNEVAKMSEVIYDEGGHLLMPFLNPLPVHRNPEGVKCQIWDQATRSNAPIVFTDCVIKSPITVVFKDKRNLIITLSIQLHDDPDTDTARLRRIVGKELMFSLEAQQEEIFNQEPDEDDDDGQEELDVDEEQEEEEEEEEDEE